MTPPPPAALEAMLDEPIVWNGDLDDDCSAKWRGLAAHAEQMDHYRDDDPESSDSWYCAVHRLEADGRWGESLFHSVEEGLHPNSGPVARLLCERIMRLEALRNHAPALLGEVERLRGALAALVDALNPDVDFRLSGSIAEIKAFNAALNAARTAVERKV